MNKKKILWVGETTHALSGYGTYGKELLTRLINMDKYHVAEFASYAVVDDPKDKHVNWRYYPNAVHKDDPRYEEYNKQITNQFGAWRFEQVLLDFQPDIVCDIRDFWMLAFEHTSPLRPYYHWAIMPTVDSAPQKNDWIEVFLDADGVFTYSDWGLEVLRKQSDGRIKLQQSAPPGVDPEVFKPVENKAEHRKQMGFAEDAFIIGTIMRNQKRKLYPDLFKAFRMFLDNADPELAKKTFLYVHTSFPDRGWNLPALINEFGIGHKVLFTYHCRATGKYFCSFFQDAKTYSPYSQGITGVLPSVSVGLEPEELSEIYNLFDVYVQYSICEGFGMPQVEAAACGVPVMAVDYSAMSDVVRKTGGFPLKVERMFREFETGADRAYPDNEYFAKTIEKFFTMSDEARAKYSDKARQAILDIYNWDRTTQIWSDYFDSVELCDRQGQWDAPVNLHQIPDNIPTPELSTPEFVRWLCTKVLNEPNKEFSLLALDTIKDLNYGATFVDNDFKKFEQQDAYERFKIAAMNKIMAEQVRSGMIPTELSDFIQYAHKKEAGL